MPITIHELVIQIKVVGGSELSSKKGGIVPPRNLSNEAPYAKRQLSPTLEALIKKNNER